MKRPVIAAVMLGALVAAGSVFAGRELGWRDTGRLGPPAETDLAAETWPFCTATADMVTEADWAQLDPDFAAGKRALFILRSASRSKPKSSSRR